MSAVPLPRARNGRVEIPDQWWLLASAVKPEDSEAAQQLARFVLVASEHNLPTVTASPEASSAPPDARHDGHPPANLLAETAGQVAVDMPPSAATDSSNDADQTAWYRSVLPNRSASVRKRAAMMLATEPCGHRCGPEGCLAPGCPVNADAEDLAAAAARCATNGCERLKSRDGLCEPCLEEALNERRDADFDPERDEW